MTCVLARKRIVDIDSTIRILYVSVRSGLACACDNPTTLTTGLTLRITRRGEDSGTIIIYPAFNRDAEGNVGFYLDSLLYTQPNGLYSATVYNGTVPCKPYITLRIGRPCRVDGAYTVAGGNVNDENPS